MLYSGPSPQTLTDRERHQRRDDTVADWNHALDSHIAEDIDGVMDALAAQCVGERTSLSAVASLGAHLAHYGALLDVTPAIKTAELLTLLFIETPDIAMQARALLRERLLAEHSEAVADIYWRRQDEAQAPREIDACDAYRRWRDRDLEERT